MEYSPKMAATHGCSRSAVQSVRTSSEKRSESSSQLEPRSCSRSSSDQKSVESYACGISCRCAHLADPSPLERSMSKWSAMASSSVSFAPCPTSGASSGSLSAPAACQHSSSVMTSSSSPFSTLLVQRSPRPVSAK
eukprot:scaffold188777_cov30-Tisochrysis_lutea.AAC.2